MLNRILPRTPRFGCPDEHQLAAYVDQQLIGAERERVESHLAKCDSCLQQIGFLSKQSQVAATHVPANLLHRAQRLQTTARQSAPLAWKWGGVAVAIAVVAIGLRFWREARSHEGQRATMVAKAEQPRVRGVPEAPNPGTETAVRSASPSVSLPVLLSPEPGATVRASDLVIRWKPIANATAYEVRVVTADGDLVWRKRVHENSVNPPNQTLRAGMKYFVWVRALLPDGKTQQSAAVGFVGG